MKKTTQISFLLFFLMCWLPLGAWALDPPFDNTTGALKSTEIVPGKQIALWIVSNSDGNRWFSRENNNDKKRSATLTDYCIFMVEASESNDGVVLRRKVDNKYMKKGTAIEWTENKSEACSFEVVNPKDNFNYDATNLNAAPSWDPDYATYLVRFVLKGTANFLNSDVQAGFATGIGPWSAYFAYDVASGLKLEALKNFQKTLEEAKRYPLGDGLGQYKDPQNKFESLLNEAMNQDPETLEVEELESLADQLNEMLPQLTLNMPQTGRFYRLKSGWNNKYIASNGIVGKDQSVGMVTETDGKNTVYYLTQDNRLINSMVLAMERNLVSSANGGAFTVEAHPEIIGAYTLSDLEHENSALYALSDHLDWVEYDYRENNHCAWILEEVTDQAEQPVLTKEFEGVYATLSAPVALNIPDGLEVYVITGIDSDKNELQTMSFTDPVVPAGCPVLLKRTGTEQAYTFTFASEGQAEEGILVANYADSHVPASVNAYVLADGEQGICFYQLSDTDRAVGAHSAYLVISESDAKVFYLDQEATGFGNILQEDNQAEVYYDLHGRKCANPSKGIYVTGKGKKLLVD